MAPLGDRKQARANALADHKAEQQASTEHILNARNKLFPGNEEYRNPPLKTPPINPVPSQKLASTKEANRVIAEKAAKIKSAKAKIELDVAAKVEKPPVIAPVWTPNT